MIDSDAPQRTRSVNGAHGADLAHAIGSERGAERRNRPRPMSARHASNKANKILKGQNLPAYKQEMVRIACRVITHFENASNRLYFEGETTKEGEPRQLLQRASDLAGQAFHQLDRVFSDGDGERPTW